MPKTIIEYQKAFNYTLEELKKKECVLAILVFGSIMNGDLWEKSDIDIIVICKEFEQRLKNIYTQYNNIPIHMKLIGKDTIKSLCTGDNKGDYIHRIFSSSKLVFSRDKDVDRIYNEERAYNDINREKWNMVFLSKVLKSISECKKYLYIDSVYNAYTLANIVLRNYSELIINSSGYMINRDVVNMALNLDNNLLKEFEKFLKRDFQLEITIENFINYIETEVYKNIKNYSAILIHFMTKNANPLSSGEIKNCKIFKDYKIDMEEILNKLYELNIINRDKRRYKTSLGETLIEENVYYI